MTDPGFLADLHAGFQVPRAAVVDLVRRATGVRPAELIRLTVGDENEIYRAELDRGVVYVRIRRPGAGSFDAEVWAMDLARAAGVPVPEVGAIESLDAGPEGERGAMVVAAAPGRPLSDLLPGLTGDRRRTALINVGRTLALLHTVPTPGPGRPDQDGRWPDPVELHRRVLAERTGQRRHLETAGLTTAEVAATLALIGLSPDVPARADPVLRHGDLHAAHVFVDDELAVSGVIDWGLWLGGSAIGDLSYVSMRYPAADFTAILSGHGIGRPTDPELRRRLALAVLNQAIDRIAWSEKIGNAEGSARDLAALRAALAVLAELGLDDRLEVEPLR